LCKEQEYQENLGRQFPVWAAIRVQFVAKYLGFMLGPKREHRSFEKPLQKYSRRAEEWGRIGAGLCCTTVAYKVYILSTMTFVAQLEILPPSWPEAEAAALRRLLPGPGAWIQPVDAHRLEQMGTPSGFLDLQAVSVAARFRLACCESVSSGGLQVVARAAALRRLGETTDFAVRAGCWHNWISTSYIFQLDAAVDIFRRRGITQVTIENNISEDAMRPFTQSTWLRIRRGFQKAAAHIIASPDVAALETRLRLRLERWAIPEFPRIRAARALVVLNRLRNLAPPRVVAAIIRTLFNGWVTERRMQMTGSGCIGCVFGCHAEDSVEHYAHCAAVKDFAWRRLRLRYEKPLRPLAEFLLLDQPPSLMDDDFLLRSAIRTATIYKAHCWRRHAAPGSTAAAQCIQALQQALRAVVNGHAGATAAVAKVWAT
jgi:hypothetical protein